MPALCHCNPFWADPAPLQKGRASYRHQNLLQAFASLQWGGMNVLSFVGWGSPFTPRTHVSHCLSGISLNLIFWYNLFPVLKKHLSSTLVHYHLIENIILTTHELIVLDFLLKSPSRVFFFFFNSSGCRYNSSFVFFFPCTL